MNWVTEIGQRVVERRRLLASAALTVFAAFLFAHVLMGQNGWLSYRQKKAEYRRLEQEVQQMDQENQRLDNEIKALKSDPKAIEKEAREQLRYAKPGEIIYLLPDDKPQAPAQGTPQQPAQAAHK